MSTKTSERTRRLVLGGLFVAIIVVMTAVPYTGYISYSPLSISITTLHIPVILGAVLLGWKYGAMLGGVWGLTCLVKAFLEPIAGNIPFQNPIVSVLPRIIVGLAAAGIFILFTKVIKLQRHVSALITAILSTVVNTFLVLGALFIFGDLGTTTLAETFDVIIKTLVALNGIIEIAAAAILVPVLYAALSRLNKNA